MALIYLSIGFFYKDKIKQLSEFESRKYDLAAGAVAVALVIFCWFIYTDGNRLYYFDMKPVYYVSAKYCYITHELRLHQNDRCKRFTPV